MRVQRKCNSQVLRQLLYESVLEQVWKKDTETMGPSPDCWGRAMGRGELILSRPASSVFSQRHLVTLKRMCLNVGV